MARVCASFDIAAALARGCPGRDLTEDCSVWSPRERRLGRLQGAVRGILMGVRFRCPWWGLRAGLLSCSPGALLNQLVTLPTVGSKNHDRLSKRTRIVWNGSRNACVNALLLLRLDY